METFLLLASVVIFACVAFNKLSGRFGVPGLFVFILLGMVFGSDGLFKIPFDNYSFASDICSVALIFIMFYGGFGTKWSLAKPVAVKAMLLSSLGTVITAGLVGVFCYFVLKFHVLEAFLMGAVICSTDAASVFSILRSKKINLKYGTASLLEVESGSNDPFSYMLTAVILSLMEGKSTGAWSVVFMLVMQILMGVAFGVIIAVTAKKILKKLTFKDAGFDAVFTVGVAVLSFVLPALVGGNGYLSAYITGIILGNSKIPNKKGLVHFFDGVTGLMQMLLFFLLGLLSFPSKLPAIALTAVAVVLFLTFVARPVAIFAVLSPFKCKINQQAFVAWSGMRGAASIVFAIMAITSPAALDNDIFHIVFFIVLFSVLVQGTLLPFFAKKFNMIDENADVMKTFTDYADEIPVRFIQFGVHKGHEWDGKRVADITLPPECILVLLIRNGEKIVPKGRTVLKNGDTLILSGVEGGEVKGVHLYEHTVEAGDEWVNRRIYEFPSEKTLIILIRRKNHVVIPKGDTVILENDILVINDMSE
ncbi:MAG: potassium/proton antiporter [Clostridia bacterium]|nr:potassium/proton antiporter [Clostridia bacterium]